VVADRWRAQALTAAFAERGVADQQGIRDAEFGYAVRTDFAPELVDEAARWSRGADERPPVELRISAGALRLWAISSGRMDQAGYVFATSRAADVDDAVHQAAGSQLARLGLAAASLANRGGPGWRITSARRLRRLAELVGQPPDGAGSDWPC